MDAEAAVAFLEVPLGYPGAKNSGEYLRECVQAKARWLLGGGERQALIGALRLWIEDRSEPRTMLAVAVVGTLALTELKPELVSLRADLDSGRCFMRFYIQHVDAALSELRVATDRAR